MNYKQKYIKYKQKYMELQRYQLGGKGEEKYEKSDSRSENHKDEEQEYALGETEQEDKDKLKKDSEKSDIKSSDVSLGGNEIPYKSFPLMTAEQFKKNRHYIPTIIRP